MRSSPRVAVVADGLEIAQLVVAPIAIDMVDLEVCTASALPAECSAPAAAKAVSDERLQAGALPVARAPLALAIGIPMRLAVREIVPIVDQPSTEGAAAHHYL